MFPSENSCLLEPAPDKNRVGDFFAWSLDCSSQTSTQVLDCDWEITLHTYDTCRSASLTQSGQEAPGNQYRAGDIRLLLADVRINGRGRGPDTDKHVESLISGLNFYQNLPLGITSPMEASAHLGSLVGGGLAGLGESSTFENIVRQYVAVRDKMGPFEAYVSFEYEIFLKYNTGFKKFLFGEEVWYSPPAIINQPVIGDFYGGFPSGKSAFDAGFSDLSKLYFEAQNNIHARSRRFGENFSK